MTAEAQCNISNLETISRNPNDTMNNLIYLIVITSCCPLHVQTKQKSKRQKKKKRLQYVDHIHVCLRKLEILKIIREPTYFSPLLLYFTYMGDF